jgi:hypothetical protein
VGVSWRGGVPVRFLGPWSKEDKGNRGRENGLCVLPTHTAIGKEEGERERKLVLAGRWGRERTRCGETERAGLSSQLAIWTQAMTMAPMGSRTHGQEECNSRLLRVWVWMMGLMWLSWQNSSGLL